MYDLIYLDYYGEAPKVLQKIWPKAKIEDASDFIHTERFAIEANDVEEEEYFNIIIREDMASRSLSFRSLILEDGQKALRLLRKVAAEKDVTSGSSISKSKGSHIYNALDHPKLRA